MRKIQIIIFLQLVVIVSSCQIGKKTTYEKKPMPEWVSTKPQSTMYYVGISSAPKKGFLPGDYMA
ncbi:MAG: hypothetical protein PHW83_06335, partial [Bacteroidales bacterium]|nr:hypothetical protein [Bacteroidales bacterium]